MKNAALVSELLDRLADEARDAGRLEREKDIADLGTQEMAAEVARLRALPGRIDPDSVEGLIADVVANKKINTIKMVRAMTGMPLQDAKTLVERARPSWKDAIDD